MFPHPHQRKKDAHASADGVGKDIEEIGYAEVG